MGAYPFGDQNVLVFFARSRGVLGVVGLATRVGYCVRQVIAAGVQLIQHFLGAIHDPNGFAAPFDGEQHAWFELEISTSMGAPAAFARSLGNMLNTKGLTAATVPIAPTVDVALTKKRRFLGSAESPAMRELP